MQIGIFSEPHRGATYADELRLVQHVEQYGFASYVRPDHYQTLSSAAGVPGPTDAWVTLGALSQATSTIRLGTLVSAATFRLPGPLSVIVAQVDEMSGGRLDLGLGTAWYAKEHASYGIPFPRLGERLDRLTEQLEILRGLWSTPPGSTFTYRGAYYQLVDSPALPKPHQRPGPPIIVGGRGPRRTPEIAARFADEFNGVFQGVADTAKQYQRVREASERLDRAGAGMAPLRLSIGLVVACGATEAEARRRGQALYEAGSAVPHEDPVVGSPDEVVQRIGEFADIGAEKVYLRLPDMSDLAHVDLIAERVLPQVANG